MPQREMTFGEKAVGLTFNPGGDPQVQKVKAAFAAIIDDLHDQRVKSSEEGKGDKVRMFSQAITDAQAAQMWAVKSITWQF